MFLKMVFATLKIVPELLAVARVFESNNPEMEMKLRFSL